MIARVMGVVVAAWCVVSSASAQAPSAAPDSAHVRRDAERAQERFERIRIQELPWVWDGGSSGSCDERVGRFCLTFDDADDEPWTPPPETERVQEARDTLLARLRDAAARVRGDWWISGQLVRYLVEDGRVDEARDAARRCSAERWWCLALETFALHAGERFAEAEPVYDSALALMPAQVHDAWSDLSLLLPREARREFQHLHGAERDRITRRFWWLADPLYLVPGNERRTEHASRLVMNRLQERAWSPERTRWGDDLKELLLRYGWPSGWQHVRRSGAYALDRSGSITRYGDAWAFLPPLDDARHPERISEDGWRLDSTSARTGYAPPYVERFDSVAYQVALFRRGDSVLVIGVLALPRDDAATVRFASGSPGARRRVSGWRTGEPVQAALFIRGDSGDAMVSVRDSVDRPRAVLRARVAPVPSVVSLEAFSAAGRQAVRVRFALDASRVAGPGVALSDVLLLDDVPPGGVSPTLDDVLPLARAGTLVHAGERIALYWELYRDREQPAPVSVEVSVWEARAGFGRRLARALHLAGAPYRTQLEWDERSGAGPVWRRALALQLGQLREGSYIVRVRARLPDGRVVERSRELQVRE
ncbi:MAG TPA: hypothetical protein VFK13_02940 [Gemmatimonadaceae bacterium]|nr:hypothetical protein [Gemmatimonadaceae bacterium]